MGKDAIGVPFTEAKYGQNEGELFDPRESKVCLYSEDGVRFRLFVDGKELKLTRGLKITGGIVDGYEQEIEVSTTLLALPDMNTFE